MNKQIRISKKGLFKFITASVLVIMFLFVSIKPVGFNSAYAIIAQATLNFLEPILKYVVWAFMAFVFLMTMIMTLFKPKFLMRNHEFVNLFSQNKIVLLTRTVAIITTSLLVFNVGPDWFTGNYQILGTLDAAQTVIVWIGATVIILPLLISYGLDVFLGILMQPIMKPLFKVPGNGSMSAVSSFFISPAVGIYLANEEYEKGHYSDKEATTIMTTLCSLPIIALIVWPVVMRIDNELPALILIFIITLFIVGIIMPRIFPLNQVKETYVKERETVDIKCPDGSSRFNFALSSAAEKARDTRYSIYDSFMLILELLMIIVPFILAWGSIALAIYEYTPILHWLSYPLGLFLNLFGIRDAMQLAPVLLVGFIEPLIPMTILKGVHSFEIRFILGTLCFIQQINLSEIGAMVIPSKVSAGPIKLFVIFIIRTLISLPIIILLTRLLL